MGSGKCEIGEDREGYISYTWAQGSGGLASVRGKMVVRGEE